MHELQPKELDETRRRILDAAMERFRHFGYNKTTMAEIARDAGMSAANLYRYFGNKQGIAVASCQSLVEAQIALVRDAIAKHDKAVDRFAAFFRAVLEHNDLCLSEHSRLIELENFIKSERPVPLLETLEQQRQLLREVLDYGNASKEFAIADTRHTAGLLFALAESLSSSVFMVLYPNDSFNEKIAELIELILPTVVSANSVPK